MQTPLRKAVLREQAVADCLTVMVQRYNRRMDAVRTESLVSIILDAAADQRLDPLLVASVIAVESSFNPRARSRCGAEGLMQIIDSVQPLLGVDDPYNMTQNVHGGCRFLSELKHRFGRTDLMLAAYNAGPSRVERVGGVPQIEETIHYVRRVAILSARLRADVNQRAEALSLLGLPAGAAAVDQLRARDVKDAAERQRRMLTCFERPRLKPAPAWRCRKIDSLACMAPAARERGCKLTPGLKSAKDALAGKVQPHRTMPPAQEVCFTLGACLPMAGGAGEPIPSRSEGILKENEVDFPPRDDLVMPEAGFR